MTRLLLSCFALLVLTTANAGDTLRALFIGNSYTEVNNLPNMVSSLATAGGDSLYYQVSAPGGQTFQQHCSNPTTLSLIAQGDWDFVVLQEQSQRPSFDESQVADEVYPYAKRLDSLVHHFSPCAKTVFYMTWGRKNGDASNCVNWPPVCTYEGMDSLLQLRYTTMAQQNESVISPVAKVWRNLRDNHPTLELYQPDESHPSVAGTYAAALSFYTLFFAKDASTNTFISSLSVANANIIKEAAQNIVFDSLHHWRRFHPYPRIDSINIENLLNYTVKCTGVNPDNVLSYEWDFGDGSLYSYHPSPTHTYADGGTYEVCVTVANDCDAVRYCKTVTLTPTSIDDLSRFEGLKFYPNPTSDYLYCSGINTELNYVITNNIGLYVSAGVIDKQTSAIQLKALSAGLYFISLYDESGNKKVVKIVKH